MREYKELVDDILHIIEKGSQVMVKYLKGISNMLAIVSTIGTGNILQHLLAERRLLNLVFTFDI